MFVSQTNQPSLTPTLQVQRARVRSAARHHARPLLDLPSHAPPAPVRRQPFRAHPIVLVKALATVNIHVLSLATRNTDVRALQVPCHIPRVRLHLQPGCHAYQHGCGCNRRAC